MQVTPRFYFLADAKNLGAKKSAHEEGRARRNLTAKKINRE
jgi:hypothetical protein